MIFDSSPYCRPTKMAPPRARRRICLGRRTDAHERREFLQSLLPDAGDFVEFSDLFVGPMGDDALRRHFADAGKLLQVLVGGRVEVERMIGRDGARSV